MSEYFDTVATLDNPFVFTLIFPRIGINSENQPKFLLLVILISIILRIVFILEGARLVERFHENAFMRRWHEKMA